MDKRPQDEGSAEDRPLHSVPIGQLLGRFVQQATALVKKELELARAEVGSSVQASIKMGMEFAAAAAFGVVGLALLCTACVLALASVVAPWAAALIVAIAMFAVTGVLVAVAKSKAKKPLERTQRTLKEDVRWARERMA